LGSDDSIRARFGDLPVPQFEPVATVAPPLNKCCVAIVTTAGLQPSGKPWRPPDSSFEVLERGDRRVQMRQASPNFDRVGIAIDLNVVYPADRLAELESDGTIGSVAPHHVSFNGAQHDLSTMILDSAPTAAQFLLDEGVDVVLLTPVCAGCTRTVSVLAHVFEKAGLATVAISSIRGQAESGRAPRALHCEFPIGRPLGRPGDADFQTDVLRTALALLGRVDVPVLVDYPVVIEDESNEIAACPLPLPHDPTTPAPIAEARGLRNAYERNLGSTGRTVMGQIGGADEVEHLLGIFVRLASGETLSDVGWDSAVLHAAGQDVRAYYEEAAIQLADSTGARQIESWFYRTTATGSLLREVQRRLREASADRDTWYYLLPSTQAI
jgi:D-proline reductase (dithiol) PrdB